MTKISGWVFMIIGAAMALFSRYIQKKGGEGMDLFFWVGVIVIGIGVFKVAAWFILRKERKAKEEKEGKKQFTNPLQKLRLNKDLEGVDGEKLEQEKNQAMKKIQETAAVVSCPNCGTKHYSNSNFCHLCGTRLK
ncbi:MAG: zinc-ribbon domain-containing protein [Candidatus Nanoarchaeia archaeon]